MTQSVVRLSGRAAFLLERIAEGDGKKKSDLLHELICEYAKGLTFADDPDLTEWLKEQD